MQKKKMNSTEEKYLNELCVQDLKWISRKLHLRCFHNKDVLVAQILKFANTKSPACYFSYRNAVSELKREKRLEKLKTKKTLEKKELLDHLRTHLKTEKVVQLEKILNEFYKSKYKIK